MYDPDEIYKNLMKSSTEKEEEFSGVDAFLDPTAGQKEPDRIKVASLDSLSDFFRIGGTNNLVHKAKKDLWRIGQDEKGELFIERLFDPESNKPIRI